MRNKLPQNLNIKKIHKFFSRKKIFFDARAKNKFLFIIFFYFFCVSQKKVGNPSYFRGITVIFLKKIFFFRGKRFMIFVTVIFFFFRKRFMKKTNDSYKKREFFSPEKKYFFQKNDSYTKIYTHFFGG